MLMPSGTLSPTDTLKWGSTRAIRSSAPTLPYRYWSAPSTSSTSTVISIPVVPSLVSSLRSSGRSPSTPFSMPGARGSWISKPDALAVWPCRVTGMKFIFGLPMKPATYMFAGCS